MADFWRHLNFGRGSRTVGLGEGRSRKQWVDFRDVVALSFAWPPPQRSSLSSSSPGLPFEKAIFLFACLAAWVGGCALLFLFFLMERCCLDGFCSPTNDSKEKMLSKSLKKLFIRFFLSLVTTGSANRSCNCWHRFVAAKFLLGSKEGVDWPCATVQMCPELENYRGQYELSQIILTATFLLILFLNLS